MLVFSNGSRLFYPNFALMRRFINVQKGQFDKIRVGFNMAIQDKGSNLSQYVKFKHALNKKKTPIFANFAQFFNEVV